MIYFYGNFYFDWPYQIEIKCTLSFLPTVHINNFVSFSLWDQNQHLLLKLNMSLAIFKMQKQIYKPTLISRIMQFLIWWLN